jgi:hypothetical protein
MKNSFNKIYLSFSITILLPLIIVASNDVPLEHIKQEITTLNRILELAHIITFTESNKTNKDDLKKAQTELGKLIKQLDSTIKNIIFSDIEIIRKTRSKDIYQQVAYKRLVAKINTIKAQVEVIETTEQAAHTIAATPDALKAVQITKQQQKVEAAEKDAQQQGIVSHITTQIFGKEASWAKTAFYAAVGAATIGALYYGYQHAGDIAKQMNSYLMGAIKRVSRQKSPLDIFMQKIMQLRHIAAIAHETEKKYAANPTEENRTNVEYVTAIMSQQADNIEVLYENLSPELQQKAEIIFNKLFGE